MFGFDDSYEVCNCNNVTIQDIKDCVKKSNIKNLRQLQDYTIAVTQCRNCVFEDCDFGMMKKKIYCKEILENIVKES